MIRLTAIILLLAIPAAASAQTPHVAELDAYIAAAREAWQVPGLAVAIVKDDAVVLAKGYGVRTLGGGEPVDADTLFAIASNTKAFTAATLAMLEEQGDLDWDDPVQRHLPYFQLYDPYVSADMRIADLLCHRSGLGTFSGDLVWYGTDYTPEQIIRRTRFVPAAGPFRTHYGYSNLMFVAAGEVVARTTGKPWPEFVRERILEPLEMRRTVVSTKELESRENIASPHKITPDGVRPLEWYNWDSVAAAGGIISSVNDMAKWLRLQLNRGQMDDGTKLFSKASSARMWSPHTIIPLSDSLKERYPSTHFRAYGLGWSLSDYRGQELVSHGGGYDGMFSRVVLVPEQNLGMIVLTNSMTGISTALCNRIVDSYLGETERDWSRIGLKRDRDQRRKFYQRIAEATAPRVEGTQPAHPLEDYTGTFSSELYGVARVVLEQDLSEDQEPDGRALVLRLLPNSDFVADLTHLHYNTFLLRWRKEFAWFTDGTAHFVTDAKGKVVEIQLSVPNDDFWFDELKLKRLEGP